MDGKISDDLFRSLDPQVVEKLLAAGIEQVQSQGFVCKIDFAQWDMLGECLVVQLQSGQQGGQKTYPMVWTLPHATAVVLHFLLEKALSERDSAVPTKQ